MPSASKARATRHYFDSTFKSDAVKILPNEYYVTTSDEDLMLSTVLGSCVAACLRDPVTGVGGMNHFMLPEGDASSPASATMRYGSFAMEVLINELIKAGAARERLEAKVFGGGAVLSAMQQMNIGERNGQFVLSYLKTEGIPVLAQDLGDVHARRINFFPREGRVMVRRMAPHHQKAEVLIAQREEAAAQFAQSETRAPQHVERFTRPGGMKVERFDKPAGGMKVERFDKPAGGMKVERFDKPAGGMKVERFDKPAGASPMRVERFDKVKP
ncbi:chemoreceptor glutamine deamidase CheD [Bordetella genomosp. 13]|uniref:chemoreceptor glutamine deamidase CheD n=1 Tax=Bordetella genomosp. 13 TaxID=463040 RepID=UPI00119D5146|nr:chemoreceptor glutamine deamidase CheD [Bordetella genomosp. 13]